MNTSVRLQPDSYSQLTRRNFRSASSRSSHICNNLLFSNDKLLELADLYPDNETGWAK